MTLKMTACGLEVRRVRHQAVTTIILTLTIITRLITMAVITNLARALCLTEFIEEKGREMLMYLEQDITSSLASPPYLSMLRTTSRLELRM